MFWILNKLTNKPAICGSIVSLSKETNIKNNSLYEIFSRKKEKDYITKKYRIHKLDIIKAKRK